jgi:hypothetical protein
MVMEDPTAPVLDSLEVLPLLKEVLLFSSLVEVEVVD